MQAVLLITLFLTLVIVLGMRSKKNFELEGEVSVVPPRFKIKLKNSQETPEKAKKKT